MRTKPAKTFVPRRVRVNGGAMPLANRLTSAEYLRPIARPVTGEGRCYDGEVIALEPENAPKAGRPCNPPSRRTGYDVLVEPREERSAVAANLSRPTNNRRVSLFLSSKAELIMRALLLVGSIALLIPADMFAQTLPLARSGSAASLAFARYIASVQQPNAFTESGPVAVLIQASLPGLYKQSAALAVRLPGGPGRGQYQVLQITGDATVVDEVIVPYISAQQQVAVGLVMSAPITPANYKFTYVGEVGSGDNAAFVYRIAPKKKRGWLIAGQLWIDAASGAAVLRAGRLVRPPSAEIRRMELVSDTKLLDGTPCTRVTHIAMDTQRLGRSELTITEYRLGVDGGPAPQLPGWVAY